MMNIDFSHPDDTPLVAAPNDFTRLLEEDPAWQDIVMYLKEVKEQALAELTDAGDMLEVMRKQTEIKTIDRIIGAPAFLRELAIKQYEDRDAERS